MVVVTPRHRVTLNVVLDMDATLIDHDGDTPIARPHLERFLYYCFDTFTRVSLWTAANEPWMQEVHSRILKPILDQHGFAFDFMHHRDQCTARDGFNMKFLEQLYETFPGRYDCTNTLIVDDSPLIRKCNPHNTVPVPAFDADENPDDEVLCKLIWHLHDLSHAFQRHRNIMDTIQPHGEWWLPS
jgi:TFIIF-interacting CTD phosphatase-like protein